MIFFVTIFLSFFLLSAQGLDLEALHLCSNVHRADVHEMKDVDALFVSNGCGLRCFLNGGWLLVDPINEGWSCPGDSLGICRKGECVNKEPEAMDECSKKHGLNFSAIHSAGTGYRNDHCAVECIIDGQQVSLNVRNQGLPCRKDSGFCANGICEQHGQITHNVSYYRDTHNLESMIITVVYVEFYEKQNHSNTFVRLCLVPAWNSTMADCSQTCTTVIVTELTGKPIYNHRCDVMRVNSSDQEGVLVRVEDTNGNLLGHRTLGMTEVLGRAEYDFARGVSVNKYAFVLMFNNSFNIIPANFYVVNEFKYKT